MSAKLHPLVQKSLRTFLPPDLEKNNNLAHLQHLIRKVCSEKAGDYPHFLYQLRTALGNDEEPFTEYQRELSLQESVEKTKIHQQLTTLRKQLFQQFELRFPNTYQCCAFLLLTMFPEKNQEEILHELSPNPLLFETTESFDYDGDPSFRWEDPLTTRLVIDWCPHSLLTDPDILAELIWKDHLTSFQPFKDTYLYTLYTYFADLPFEELPHLLKTTCRFGINEWIQLLTFPNLKSWAQEQLAECILRLDKDEYRLKEAIPSIPATIPRYDEIINHLLSLNGLFLKELDPVFKDREELVLIAIEENGLALSYATERFQLNNQFIEKAIRKTPLVLTNLPESIRHDPKWILLALEQSPEMIQHLDVSSFDQQKQKEYWTSAISTLPHLIQHVPIHFRQNHADLFQLAFQKDTRTVIFAQPEDVVPDNQLRSILQQHPLLFAHLPEKTKSNIELLKIVIEKEPKLYRYLPTNLKANPDFANTALDVNPYSFPEIQAHFIPDTGRIKKIIETNPLLIPAHYITRYYAAETSLCEQYLGAILSSKNKGLLDLEDEETNFQTREQELKRTLQIYNDIHRKNHLSKGLANLLENTDNPETDSLF